MLVPVITAIVQLRNHFFNNHENEIVKKSAVNQHGIRQNPIA